MVAKINKIDFRLRVTILISVFFIHSSLATNARFRPIEVPLQYGELLVRSIQQNNEGFMLLGTDSGVYQFDGFKLSPYLKHNTNFEQIRSLSISDLITDKQENLWIATRGEGLYNYNSAKLQNFSTQSPQHHQLTSDFITDILLDNDSTLWLATDGGLNSIGIDLKVKHYNLATEEDPNWQFMTSILSFSKDELLIGTKAGLIAFNRQNSSFKKINLDSDNKPTLIYTLHQDQNAGIWVGSDRGVFYRSNDSIQFTPFKQELIPYKILAITSAGDDVWLGSISNGLFHHSFSKQSTQQFKYQREHKFALPDNTILDLFIDASGVLWVSTFYKGLYNLDIQSLHFGLENDSPGSVECADNLLFSGFEQDESGDLWIANGTNLIQYNIQTKLCHKYEFNQGSHTIKSLLIDSNKRLWLATTIGLYLFNQDRSEFVPIITDVEQSLTNFVIEKNQNLLLLGTVNGLYEYQVLENQLIHISTSFSMNKSLNLYSSSINPQGQLYFASNYGLIYLDEQQLSIDNSIQKQLPSENILYLFYATNGNLWIGTEEQGVFVFNQKDELVFQESHFGDVKPNTIKSIIQAEDGNIWMGTDSGLIRINAISYEFKVFYPSDGVQGLSFNINSVYQSIDGRLIFGGRNGFNAFYPEFIASNTKAPNIALTDFTHFGRSVSNLEKKAAEMSSKDEFSLPKPINRINELTLTHLDYVIGFEFAVLDYSDPKRNHYAFQMQGLDPNWNYVNSDNRRISYSNLKPGNYVFRVKGANKHGTWSASEKTIMIKVLPAPWLSWWAICSYIAIILFLMIWLMNRKSRLNHKINIKLKSEIKKQTQEIQKEKKVIEDLLAKKNQLFANVSHEFRTPMTLILGPIKNLLTTPLNSNQHKTLVMIQRNSNRLMTMIEQLLQLAKMAGKQFVAYHNIKTQKAIEDLVNNFQALANAKHIDLQLIRNDQACLYLSQDGLEVILSNLLSNAIKYTSIGGQITVISELKANILYVSVKDTGAGLDEQQIEHIFERFKRLERDQNIEGIGIGLCVVKELVELNKGWIEVQSKPGAGSCFSFSFKCVKEDCKEIANESKVLLVKQLTQIDQLDASQQSIKSSKLDNKDHKQSVLIIDDNRDMRNYIAETLNNHYHCILANGGKNGISMAIEQVPDVVICDVMMPEVDGFHVSRVLRSDSRTSHIPLILLTALDDKESRVKGWREHVDVYLTKPFDAQELLLQLENIIVIRTILSKKAGSNFQAGKHAGVIDLPKKDQEFISKLNQLISENYKNPNFLRQQMASKMAVSDRQLQRKLKALIDKNPNDLLREYRLSQAAIMLKEGYQVSLAAEECGFNSLPHFSKCFKSQFGLSPKAYQQTCN